MLIILYGCYNIYECFGYGFCAFLKLGLSFIFSNMDPSWCPSSLLTLGFLMEIAIMLLLKAIPRAFIFLASNASVVNPSQCDFIEDHQPPQSDQEKWNLEQCIPKEVVMSKYKIRSNYVGSYVQFMNDHMIIIKFLGI